MGSRTEEIQNYIDETIARRRKNGFFDYQACQTVLEYAAELRSDAISGMGYYYFAEFYWNQGDYEEAMYCLGECTKCFKTAEMYELLARAYNLMGIVTDAQGNRVIALNYYYTGLQYAEMDALYYVQALISGNIGKILMRLGKYEEAVGRFEQAILHYEQAVETYHRLMHMINCMLRCGICYLKLDREKDAFRLWDRVEELRRDSEDKEYSKPNFLFFRLACRLAKGETADVHAGIEEILDCLQSLTDVTEVRTGLTEIAELITEHGDTAQTDRFFRIVQNRWMDAEPVMEMELYPCRSSYLMRQNRREEYLYFTRRYFTNYEQNRQNELQVTARMMEMRDMLLKMEKERERMRAANRKLESIALYDSMTNLANRTYLNEYISAKFEEARQNGSQFGIELMDIDYFKGYNDTKGHLAGDVCIEAVADILKRVQNERVFCGRYGGDEFMLVYTGMTKEEIQQVAEQIQTAVRALAIPYEASKCADIVTVSQGIFVRIPEEDNREWDYSVRADAILYEAKEQGKNCYKIDTGFFSS